MKKRLVAGLAIVTISGFAGAVLFVPTWRTIVAGILHGEKTYRGKPTSYWTRILTDDEQAASAGAVAVLKRGGAAAVPMLIQGLGDPDPQKRAAAADALGRIGADAVQSLVLALKDADATVRIGASRALRPAASRPPAPPPQAAR